MRRNYGPGAAEGRAVTEAAEVVTEQTEGAGERQSETVIPGLTGNCFNFEEVNIIFL